MLEGIPHSPFAAENMQHVANNEPKGSVSQILLAAQDGPPVLILARACGQLTESAHLYRDTLSTPESLPYADSPSEPCSWHQFSHALLWEKGSNPILRPTLGTDHSRLRNNAPIRSPIGPLGAGSGFHLPDDEAGGGQQQVGGPIPGSELQWGLLVMYDRLHRDYSQEVSYFSYIQRDTLTVLPRCSLSLPHLLTSPPSPVSPQSAPPSPAGHPAAAPGAPCACAAWWRAACRGFVGAQSARG